MAQEEALLERARLCRLLARTCSVLALNNALTVMAARYDARAAETGAAASFQPPDYHRHAIAPPQLV